VSYITFLIVSAIDRVSVGSKYAAAFPATSGKELDLLTIAGHPQANDSSMGIPNPSYREGKINARAFLSCS
jgi:hypothetical protein